MPEPIFGLPDEQVARFLSVLFGCDGYVHLSDRISQVGYCTISERLAHDVQHLLLRFGVVGKIRTLKRKVYEGTDKVAREVRITDQGSLLHFCGYVGACGKDAAVSSARRASGTREHCELRRHPPHRGVGARRASANGRRPWRELSVATGRPANHNWHVGKRHLSRHLFTEIADWSGDER